MKWMHAFAAVFWLRKLEHEPTQFHAQILHLGITSLLFFHVSWNIKTGQATESEISLNVKSGFSDGENVTKCIFKTLAIACGWVTAEKATITQMCESSRLLLCLDNKCYHCTMAVSSEEDSGVCSQLRSGLAYLKADPPAAVSCSVCLRARLRIWSDIEMCARKKAGCEREPVCV